MTENVIWKAIPEYEGYYEASTNGEIRSLDRYVNNRNSFVKGKMMHLNLGSSGYLYIGLSKNGITKVYKVHRLIAKTFIKNPDNKPCIDHINTKRTDNRVCNLRWATLKENSRNPLTKHHAKYGKEKRIGNKKSSCQKFRNNAPNKPKPVYRYTLTGEFMDEFQSIIEAESVTRVEASGIRKALDKSYRTSGGYLWRSTKTDRCKPYKRRRHTKCIPIQMINDCGVVNRTWESIRDAATELKTTHSRILRYMDKNKPMNGYYFRFV